MPELCQWEGCDDEQFEDWFYCERHVKSLQLMNAFLWAVVS